MIRIWQDFDENCRATWGQWFGTLSFNGHVVKIIGPFLTEQECRDNLQHLKKESDYDKQT